MLTWIQPSPVRNESTRKRQVESPKSNVVPQPAVWMSNQAPSDPTRAPTHHR
jgi:hypothetical protein